VLRNRRLRDAERGRRLRHLPMLGYRQENFQQAQ
jgi:hypothetical protein